MIRRRLFVWSVEVSACGLSFTLGAGVYSVVFDTFGKVALIISAILYSGCVGALVYIAFSEQAIRKIEVAIQFGVVMLLIPIVVLFLPYRDVLFQAMAEGGAVCVGLGGIGALASFLWTRFEVQFKRPK